jgi:signal transduction histidine kinase
MLARGLPLEEREIEWVLSDGEVVPLAVSVSALTGEQDEVLGAVVILRDLRTLKALQQRVERTERLAALGRLAAGVAHEIRDPLGAIRGLVQYFQATWKEDAEQRVYLDGIVREVDRLNRVVNDLVEFARPRELQREPYDLVDIVRHAVTLVQADARAKGIHIVHDFAERLPPLFVDRDLILQALLNLLLNALEAMASGGTLRVRLADSPAWVELAIQDTGRGIPRRGRQRQRKDVIPPCDPGGLTQRTIPVMPVAPPMLAPAINAAYEALRRPRAAVPIGRPGGATDHAGLHTPPLIQASVWRCRRSPQCAWGLTPSTSVS